MKDFIGHDVLEKEVKPTIDFLQSLQFDASGNFPSSIGKKQANTFSELSMIS